DYSTQELENNHIKEKGKKEENRIVPMEVSRKKEKKATAERMEIETIPISKDTDRHIKPIVTNNKDRNAKKRVLSINWIFDSFKKRAILKIAIKNERSKQILDDSWSLPIGRKLTRIIQGENEEEVLVNRRKQRLILEGVNRNTKEEDMYKAINIKINYSNTFLFWKDISGVERPDRRNTSAVKWNQRNLSLDSDKRKKVVNGFLKSVAKLNQKNTLYEKKITHSYNKENESGETTKYKNYYNEDKRKDSHNEQTPHIKSLDEKLQIILQRLDKIEANRSRDGDKRQTKESISSRELAISKKKPIKNIQPKQREREETLRRKEEGSVLKNKGKRKEALEKGILETAMKYISKKKICKTRVTRDGKKRPRLDKLIIELGRWVRKGKRKIGRDMTEEDRKDFGLFRKNIRKKFQIEIENIDRKWEDKNIEDLSDRIEKEKLKQIEWCIERRCRMIDREQGKMLASLLEKPFNHVVVDKLLENQNNTRVLTCESEKVKEKTKEFFQKQFRRRCFDSDALREEWVQVYAPLEKKNLMIRKYKKNRLENRENLVFYMDGSLVRTSTEKGEMVRMKASWVQVGLDKEKILDTGYVEASNEDHTSRFWLRQKNQNIAQSIYKLVRLKEIHLSLVKVKGHSEILWNEIADHLARQ
ncbi:26663_t:CDS:2, partial [Gigaspora margarita]